MHPSWGGYGGGPQPPPHFGPRPHQFRGAQPPSAAAPAQAAAGGGFGGYGAPSVQASSNFSSLHEQHLQQMQQLQQLHQKQLQSVLHHSGNNTSSGPAPYWQAGGAPPNTFQDPSTQRGPAGQPQPPPPDHRLAKPVHRWRMKSQTFRRCLSRQASLAFLFPLLPLLINVMLLLIKHY